jgi:HEAT repeat protein
VLRATHDFDPYVRTQAIEALRRIDPRGEDAISRMTAREALNDLRDTVVRAACQLVIQYHDTEAVSALQQLIQTRSELAPAAYDALRQLGR